MTIPDLSRSEFSDSYQKIAKLYFGIGKSEYNMVFWAILIFDKYRWMRISTPQFGYPINPQPG